MMHKKIFGLVLCSITVLSSAQAQSGMTCHDLSINPHQAIGILSPVPCSTEGVLDQLKASNHFKDVTFLADMDPGFAYTCYVSTTPISILVDNRFPVTVISLSAWTNEFDVFGMPKIFGGPGNVATVATKLTLTGKHDKFSGTLFTRDSIDLSNFPSAEPIKESDVVIHGTKNLNGAKGTIKLESVQNLQDGTIQIPIVTGKLCVNEHGR